MDRRIFLALVAAGILMRLAGALVNPVTSDAAGHAVIATKIFDGQLGLGELYFGKENWDIGWSRNGVYYYPPVFHLAIVPFAFNGIALRLFSPVIFALTVLVFYRLAQRVLPASGSMYATLLFVYNPFSVQITSVLFSESLLLFLSVLATYLVYACSGDRDAALAGVVTGLGILAKYTLLPLVGAFAVFFAAKRQWRFLAVFVLAASVVVAPWMARNQVMMGNGEAGTYSPTGFSITDLDSIWSPSISPFQAISATYLQFWGLPEGNAGALSSLSPFLLPAFVIATLALTLVLGYSAFRGGGKKGMLVFLLMLAAFAFLKLYQYASGGTVPFRYLLPALIPLCILAGASLHRLDRRVLWAFLAGCLLVGAAGMAKPYFAKQEFDDLGKLVSSGEFGKYQKVGTYDYWTIRYNFPSVGNVAQLKEGDGYDALLLRRPDASGLVPVIEGRYFGLYLPAG